MSKAPEFTTSLQENVLAVLGYDNANCKVVANLVDPSLFEGDYRVIAESCVAYIKEYGHAPGRAHIKDVLSDVLDDPESRSKKTYLKLIEQMRVLSEEMDTRYILDKLNTFVRLQTLKRTTITVAEKLQTGQERSIAEVEELWHDILKADAIGFVPGMRGTDIDRVLEYVRTQHSEFYTGIPILDERGIVPSRATADLFIASTGMGKSWWLVNIGKQALLQRKRVLHVTLEMSEEEVLARYLQTFCSIGTFERESMVAEFDRDDDNKVTGLSMVGVKADYTLNSPWARDELQTYIRATESMFNNLIIKGFSTGSLTIAQLEAFLDTLERVEGFVPDILILDYLGLLHIDIRDYRLGLGRVFKNARGLAKDRNMALSTAHQSNRIGASAQTVNISDVSEDWSLTGTADQVFTYTSTAMENFYGLGRMLVGKARNKRDKFSVVVAGNYALGQFCVDSHLLNDDYWNLLRELHGEDNDDSADDNIGYDDDDDEFDE